MLHNENDGEICHLVEQDNGYQRMKEWTVCHWVFCLTCCMTVSQAKAESTTSLQLRLEIQVGRLITEWPVQELVLSWERHYSVICTLCSNIYTLFPSVFAVKSLKCLYFSSQESLGLSSAVSTPELERRYMPSCCFLVFLIQSFQTVLVSWTWLRDFLVANVLRFHNEKLDILSSWTYLNKTPQPWELLNNETHPAIRTLEMMHLFPVDPFFPHFSFSFLSLSTGWDIIWIATISNVNTRSARLNLVIFVSLFTIWTTLVKQNLWL